MNIRKLAAVSAAASAIAVSSLGTPAANANVLSLLPGSCGNESYSQPFAELGDSSNYVPVPGGSFEPGSAPWAVSGGAKVTPGNESFNARSSADRYSLALPAGSTATSLAACTSIYHPTMRFFLRNTGAASSQLKVEALYPGLLGGIKAATLGTLRGSASWKPSPVMSVLASDLVATLSLHRTIIAFRFTPVDRSGAWSIDDVYLDPRMK
jgi:hypothetical protein